MSTSISINEPSRLSYITAPLDPSIGKNHIGHSYSIELSRKRRRFEVVIGVDGESIQVFNVRRPRCVVSYPLAPQVYITTSPCCVQEVVHEQLQRFLYVPVKSTLGRDRPRLICFQEPVDRRSRHYGEDDSSVKASKYNSWFSEEDIIHVEPLSLVNREHTLVVVESNGRVACISAGARSAVWNKQLDLTDFLSREQRHSEHNEFIALLSTKFAQKINFRSKSDSDLPSDTQHNVDPLQHVLCLILKSRDQHHPERAARMILFFSLDETNITKPSPWRPSAFCSLPTLNLLDNKFTSNAAYNFDSRSGLLYQSVGNEVRVFDFIQSHPQLVSMISLKEHSPVSFVPLPNTRLLILSAHRCSIFKIQYRFRNSQEILQEVPVSNSVEDFGINLARSPFRLASYFVSAQLAIAINDSALYSIQVVLPKKYTLHRRRSRLVDAIGTRIGLCQVYLNGSQPNHNMVGVIPHTQKFSKYHIISISQKIGEALEKDDTGQLEQVYHEPTSLCTSKFSRDERAGFLGLNYATVQHELPTQAKDPTTDCSVSVKHSFRQVAVYLILGHIFNWNPTAKASATKSTDDDNMLKVMNAPLKSFDWIVSHGLLTVENVKAGLALHDSHVAAIEQVDSKMIVRAIAAFDPSLRLLHLLTTTPTILSLAGWLEIIRHLIRSPGDAGSLSSFSPAKISKASSWGNSFQVDDKAADQSAELATDPLEVPITQRAASLINCILSLGSTFSQPRISRAFRSQLLLDEIMLIIEILRNELDCSGWTSCTLDCKRHKSETFNKQERPLCTIGKVLNCALDAIGTSGWLQSELVPRTSMNDRASVSSLNRTTSHVVEGIQESMFLASFLKDFLNLEASSSQTGETIKQKKHMPKSKKEDRELQRHISRHELRIGSKVMHYSPMNSIIAGGEIKKRTARDMGGRQSNRIGRYTFEGVRI